MRSCPVESSVSKATARARSNRMIGSKRCSQHRNDPNRSPTSQESDLAQLFLRYESVCRKPLVHEVAA